MLILRGKYSNFKGQVQCTKDSLQRESIQQQSLDFLFGESCKINDFVNRIILGFHLLDKAVPATKAEVTKKFFSALLSTIY